ncbi:hypothetical protein E2562_026355 [Oryza meyeriana var. granulata]|uniref:DUF834 domain-containing protein n=1 Tax=Oryza meyeriana var. granulata TaxID=110450 RepID=A0A6G1EZ13_9ORYZ|nr:hypothetical protein E2562_026355 [Oryza meyeriana var. granulata]
MEGRGRWRTRGNGGTQAVDPAVGGTRAVAGGTWQQWGAGDGSGGRSTRAVVGARGNGGGRATAEGMRQRWIWRRGARGWASAGRKRRI